MIEETYNTFLLTKIKQLFLKEELQAYLEANEQASPIILRVNTLIKRRKDLNYLLMQRKVELGNLEWADCGIVVYKSAVPLGATPEYLAGYYIIQSASSMLPVLNLELGENMTVVDLCAAPGGKSTHIGAMMNNTGILYCNEICKERTASLRSNLSRMGVTNSIICNMDAIDFNVGRVDRVLLDAPCSGTGVIRKDSKIKTSKSKEEINKIVEVQKKLILHAFDMLKPNGVMVYSTCSILVEENENVVDYLLSNKQNAKIYECEIAIGRDGFTAFRSENFNGSLKLAKRLYPHVHNTDGFFYCKIRKTF